MHNAAKRLVWIDLEMTGLDPEKETIIEIATIVTTDQLEVVAEGPSLVLSCDESYLRAMDAWNVRQHASSGLIDAVRASNISLHDAQEKTISFLREHVIEGKAPLCGNSVWHDRYFLRRYMPRIHEFLHYRVIDVSSIKEAIRRWYPRNPHITFSKQENHRALEDIMQSIEELKHYRSFFFREHEL